MKRILFVGLLLGPGLAGALTPFGGTTAIIGWILGGITSFFVLLVAFAYWTDDRRVLSRLATLQRGEHLAYWTYTADEWKAFDDGWTPTSPIGRAFIGRDCAICGTKFVEWNVIGCSLEKVIYVIGPPVLVQLILFHYDANGAEWRESFCIPVPSGKEEEARSVTEALVQSKKRSYFAFVLYSLVAICSLLVLLLQLALWMGLIK